MQILEEKNAMFFFFSALCPLLLLARGQADYPFAVLTSSLSLSWCHSLCLSLFLRTVIFVRPSFPLLHPPSLADREMPPRPDFDKCGRSPCSAQFSSSSAHNSNYEKDSSFCTDSQSVFYIVHFVGYCPTISGDIPSAAFLSSFTGQYDCPLVLFFF